MAIITMVSIRMLVPTWQPVHIDAMRGQTDSHVTIASFANNFHLKIIQAASGRYRVRCANAGSVFVSFTVTWGKNRERLARLRESLNPLIIRARARARTICKKVANGNALKMHSRVGRICSLRLIKNKAIVRLGKMQGRMPHAFARTYIYVSYTYTHTFPSVSLNMPVYRKTA